MMKFRNISIVLWAFLVFSTLSSAAAERCEGIFADKPSATIQLNARTADQFPQLATMLKDPNAYFAEMQRRFSEQKTKTPGNPYAFDFSELGMPLVSDINQYLGKKIASVTADLARRQERNGARSKVTQVILSKIESRKQQELTLYLKYLTDLQSESQNVLSKGTVAYREVIEFSYFFGRAIGRFDTRSYPWKDRLILITDRFLEGYKPLSLQKEYDLYKERKFGVFQMPSKYKGYAAAEESFESDFADTDQLKELWIPTNVALDTAVLMRLMNTKIHLIGVTDSPIWADGYNRPAGDFWMHDVRHESFKYNEIQKYLAKNDLTSEQMEHLRVKMDDWLVELEQETAKIQDPGLREAVALTAFSFHHDSGYPLLPSAFLSFEKYKFVKLLYAMFTISGHGTFFKDPWNNLDKAGLWLKDFWRQRLDQEYQALDLAKSAGSPAN